MFSIQGAVTSIDARADRVAVLTILAIDSLEGFMATITDRAHVPAAVIGCGEESLAHHRDSEGTKR